jgi:hypothetical protein
MEREVNNLFPNYLVLTVWQNSKGIEIGSKDNFGGFADAQEEYNWIPAF